MLRAMTLLLFLSTAAVKDKQDFRIPNGLILAGAVNGWMLSLYDGGAKGAVMAAAGALLPLFLCGWLFALSMLGAGDIKLLMAVGVYLGPADILRVMQGAFAIGAGLALAKLSDRPLAAERISWFADYIRQIKGGVVRPYVDMARPASGKGWQLHFSLPILLAVISNYLIEGLY